MSEPGNGRRLSAPMIRDFTWISMVAVPIVVYLHIVEGFLGWPWYAFAGFLVLSLIDVILLFRTPWTPDVRFQRIALAGFLGVTWGPFIVLLLYMASGKSLS